MMAKGMEAIASQTPRERVTGSETVAIAADDLDKVAEEAEKFFRAINAIARKSKNKTDVYHLSVNFFNLTQKEKVQP